MTYVDSMAPHSTARRHRARREAPSEARIRLVADGVVASYIHDISARAHRGGSPAAARLRPGEPSWMGVESRHG